MDSSDLNDMTRKFLLSETKSKAPSMQSHIQALEETLELLQPRSKSDTMRVEIARSHLREMKRHHRRLQQENKKLQEKLSILEEEKTNAAIEEDYS